MLAIAGSGLIRSAASKLGKSQSALTKPLRRMEVELGQPLFPRTSRGVVPTGHRQVLLARARSIEVELQRFDQEAVELKGRQTGCLRISVAPLASVTVLPRAIARCARGDRNEKLRNVIAWAAAYRHICSHGDRTFDSRVALFGT